jgi:hypothetical protein
VGVLDRGGFEKFHTGVGAIIKKVTDLFEQLEWEKTPSGFSLAKPTLASVDGAGRADFGFRLAF